MGNLSWWWCEKGNLKFNQIYIPRRIMYVIVALYFKSFVKRKNPTELSNTKIIYNLTCFVEINSTSYVEFNVGSKWDFPEILSIILFFLSFFLSFFQSLLFLNFLLFVLFFISTFSAWTSWISRCWVSLLREEWKGKLRTSSVQWVTGSQLSWTWK